MADRIPPSAASGWSDAELERALRDLGQRIAFPPTPDLARAVRLRLADAPAGRAERAPSAWERLTSWFGGAAGGPSPRRAIAVAALALVVLGAAVLAFVPGARDTVAGWFGVRGIRIVFVEETPTPAPTPTVPAATPGASPTAALLGANLLLGERMTLAEAQARVSFQLLVPDPARLGPPDEVYLRRRADGDMVSFVYYPRPDLPAVAETGVGLLLVQFEAPEDAFFMEKGVAPSNEPRIVDVNGDDALWLGGAHYLLIAPDPSLEGDLGQQTTRTAASVLLWDENGVTYRLESELSMTQAVALAEGLEPLATPVVQPKGTPPAA
jgi:hypothetical protein